MNIFQKKLNKFTKNKIKVHSTMWTNIGMKWSYYSVKKDTKWRHKKDLLNY